MGQPTHVFDLDKIEGGIVVRRARKGERLKTLDGIERTLDPEDLVIADHVKPLSLAGVMGGWDSMITATTTNVLVEGAWFDQIAVRPQPRAVTDCIPMPAIATNVVRTSTQRPRLGSRESHHPC